MHAIIADTDASRAEAMLARAREISPARFAGAPRRAFDARCAGAPLASRAAIDHTARLGMARLSITTKALIGLTFMPRIHRIRFAIQLALLVYASSGALSCAGEPQRDAVAASEIAGTCAPPIQPVDTTIATTIVGNGTPASCTEQALASALQAGGIVKFACGGAATIRLTSQKEITRSRSTVIDGGNLITLDGGGQTRLLHFDGGGWRTSYTTITLQHVTITGGRSTGTPIPPATPPCASGYAYDGGGGAVFVKDGILHVIDATFTNNHSASPGPDVAGGAINVRGSLDLTVSGSRFISNAGSNGGAIGSLFSTLTVVNTTFSGNAATGFGANADDPNCPLQPLNNMRQRGSGGDGGAISVDGSEAATVTLACDTFMNNTGGALGGAFFRTPDGNRQTTVIDRSTFDGNSSQMAGGALYFWNSSVNLTSTTLSNNSSPRGGALNAANTMLTFTNSTIAGNSATQYNGGGLLVYSGTGTLINCTFANNHADAGSGHYGGALAGGVTYTVTNTLFWNNTSKDGWSPMQCTTTGSGGSDLQWPRYHIVGGAPDSSCVYGIAWQDAQLAALASNGGLTATMLPSSTSPARGIGQSCPAFDQRGVARPASGCTAGAVEVP
jgi:hypothetical protein